MSLTPSPLGGKAERSREPLRQDAGSPGAAPRAAPPGCGISPQRVHSSGSHNPHTEDASPCLPPGERGREVHCAHSGLPPSLRKGTPTPATMWANHEDPVLSKHVSREVGPGRRGPPTCCPARGGCGAQGQAWGHGTLGDSATGSPFPGARAAVVQAASQRTRLWSQTSIHGARRACPAQSGLRAVCTLEGPGPYISQNSRRSPLTTGGQREVYSLSCSFPRRTDGLMLETFLGGHRSPGSRTRAGDFRRPRARAPVAARRNLTSQRTSSRDAPALPSSSSDRFYFNA